MEVIEQTTHDRVTQSASFRLEEATIDELHQAIRAGQTSRLAVVRHYLARVRAFNGVASALVTQWSADFGKHRHSPRWRAAAFPVRYR
jgi:Asp-tRNA(Asn)/Glu-tRNA(Gln) amidotransferase A subunit family amidase